MIVLTAELIALLIGVEILLTQIKQFTMIVRILQQLPTIEKAVDDIRERAIHEM